MTPIEEQEQRRPPGKNFFIPVGTLIGIGAGHPGPGILTGPERSFLSRAFIKPVEGPAKTPAASRGSENRWIFCGDRFFRDCHGCRVSSTPPHISGFMLSERIV